MAYKTYVLGSIARLDVETMHHFEADVRFIRASEEYRIVGRHPDPGRTSAVGYQGIRFGLPNSLPYSSSLWFGLRDDLAAMQLSAKHCPRAGQ
ncbi:MAG: hypothetical protein EBY55_04020 [Gammaproteobacteria bacterium]|nr:hypothetical protein [Gammaproteobacteria bacterium]